MAGDGIYKVEVHESAATLALGREHVVGVARWTFGFGVLGHEGFALLGRSIAGTTLLVAGILEVASAVNLEDVVVEDAPDVAVGLGDGDHLVGVGEDAFDLVGDFAGGVVLLVH